MYSLMGDKDQAELSFLEFKKRCPDDYEEDVGIEEIVVRAKSASKRIKVIRFSSVPCVSFFVHFCFIHFCRKLRRRKRKLKRKGKPSAK